MKRYRVDLCFTLIETYFVEAGSEEEAESLALSGYVPMAKSSTDYETSYTEEER